MQVEALKPQGKAGTSWWNRTATVVAVVFMIFHLYTAYFGIFEAYFQRSIDVTFILLLVFLTYPLSKKVPRNRWFLGVDILYLILVAAIGFIAPRTAMISCFGREMPQIWTSGWAGWCCFWFWKRREGRWDGLW